MSSGVALASDPSKGKADLGDYMLHFEASPEAVAVALYGKNEKTPSYSITKEKGKTPETVIWIQREGSSVFYKDTDGDGVFDEALIRSPEGVKKFKLKVEMIEIKPAGTGN